MGIFWSRPSVPLNTPEDVHKEPVKIEPMLVEQISIPPPTVFSHPVYVHTQSKTEEIPKAESVEEEVIQNAISEEVNNSNNKKVHTREENESENAPKLKKRKTTPKTEKTKSSNGKAERTKSETSTPKKEKSDADLLSEYKEASSTWEGDWINGFKWNVTNPKGTLQRMLDCGPNDSRIKQLSVFAQAGRKSLYAFWTHSGKTLADAPIVFLGSEGESWLVASSLAQFISLQAAGLDGEMLKAWDGKDEEFDTIEEYCDGYQQFLKWVKSKKIKPSAKSKVFKTIKQEKKNHPPLAAFLFPQGKEDNYEDEDDE